MPLKLPVYYLHTISLQQLPLLWVSIYESVGFFCSISWIFVLSFQLSIAIKWHQTNFSWNEDSVKHSLFWSISDIRLCISAIKNGLCIPYILNWEFYLVFFEEFYWGLYSTTKTNVTKSVRALKKPKPNQNKKEKRKKKLISSNYNLQ